MIYQNLESQETASFLFMAMLYDSVLNILEIIYFILLYINIIYYIFWVPRFKYIYPETNDFGVVPTSKTDKFKTTDPNGRTVALQ